MLLTWSVLTEDAPQEEGDKDEDDDYPINPLVDALFDEVENLRLQVRSMSEREEARSWLSFQLFDAEMRGALIEAETREEVMREMEDRMRTMEAMYSRRLMREVSVSCFFLLDLL